MFNVHQELSSSVMFSWMFTPSFDAICQLRKLCVEIRRKSNFMDILAQLNVFAHY